MYCLMSTETELKFSAEGLYTLGEIATLTSLADYDIVDMGIKDQTDHCFDTADHALYRGKVVFRLRVKENGSVLTFKAQKNDVGADGNLYRRIEIEHETRASAVDIAAGRLPDIPPTHALIESMGQLELTPSITIGNRRRLMLIMKNDEPRFEMVLDDVTFTGPEGVAKAYEVEVENICGGESELKAVGNWLRAHFDLHDAGPSKYILGMQLVGGMEKQA